MQRLFPQWTSGRIIKILSSLVSLRFTMLALTWVAIWLVSPWAPKPFRPHQPPEWIQCSLARLEEHEMCRFKLEKRVCIQAQSATLAQVLESMSDQIDAPIRLLADTYEAQSTVKSWNFQGVRAGDVLQNVLKSYDLDWHWNEQQLEIMENHLANKRRVVYDLSWLFNEDMTSTRNLAEFLEMELGVETDILGKSILCLTTTERTHREITDLFAQVSKVQDSQKH